MGVDETATDKVDAHSDAAAAAEGEAPAVEVDAEPEVILDAEPVPEPTEAELLRARLSETEARLRAVSKAFKDLQDEMEAFRKRLELRSTQASERQAFDTVRTFFDPVMNLQRSLQQDGIEVDALRDGVRLVFQQFNDALKKLGLEPVPGEGATFDPQLHEALAVTPVTDRAQDGKVLTVYQQGFTVRGKVLQASQVVIGKYEEPKAEA